MNQGLHMLVGYLLGAVLGCSNGLQLHIYLQSHCHAYAPQLPFRTGISAWEQRNNGPPTIVRRDFQNHLAALS